MNSTVPIAVSEVMTASLQGFLSAAALHLGEEVAGDRLTQPDPQEAWRALLAASALVMPFGPLVHEASRRELDRLAQRLAALHPDERFYVPDFLRPDSGAPSA